LVCYEDFPLNKRPKKFTIGANILVKIFCFGGLFVPDWFCPRIIRCVPLDMPVRRPLPFNIRPSGNFPSKMRVAEIVFH